MARIALPDGDEDELVRLYMISPKMGAAAATFSDAVYNKSSLAVREREAARIRIAAINGCTVCLETRTESTPETLSEAEYLGMDRWRELDTLSERERLAAEFAERFAIDHLAMDDEFWTRLRGAFADDEVADLTMCCGMFLGMGRTLAVIGVRAPDERILV
jgi:alkylhydroperoxidase family enzyme